MKRISYTRAFLCPKLQGGTMDRKLVALGLNDEIIKEFEDQCDKGYLGRVVAEYQGVYRVGTKAADILAKVSGKFMNSAMEDSTYPVVGDWVSVDRISNHAGEGIISKVFSRKSAVTRKVAGIRAEEQIIATNIDYIFICMSVNKDFNIRRLERYLTIGWNSGAIPVVILTKIDLSENLDQIKHAVANIAIGMDVLYVSSFSGEGIDEIHKYLSGGKTIAFIGSSGVGKSTLINNLLGEEKMAVKNIRQSDHKGKHTTTHRELIVIENSGLVIDTPGMREIQLLDHEEGMDDSFSDIMDLENQCKFSNCKHITEPGCAVKEAIENGTISTERLESYNKLLREINYMKRKSDRKSQLVHKNKISKRAREIRNKNKMKNK